MMSEITSRASAPSPCKGEEFRTQGACSARRRRGSAYAAPLIIAALMISCLFFGIRGVLHRPVATASSAPDTYFDAGEFFASEQPVVNHTFDVRNDGPEIRRLVGKNCTCVCTSSALSQEELRPGEHATFTMSVRLPQAYSGKAKVQCELEFDDHKTITYTLVYQGFPSIMVEEDHLDFGVLNASLGREVETTAHPAALSTWIDLFAPLGRRLPVLQSIDPLDGFDIELVDSPEVSTVGKI